MRGSMLLAAAAIIAASDRSLGMVSGENEEFHRRRRFGSFPFYPSQLDRLSGFGCTMAYHQIMTSGARSMDIPKAKIQINRPRGSVKKRRQRERSQLA